MPNVVKQIIETGKAVAASLGSTLADKLGRHEAIPREIEPKRDEIGHHMTDPAPLGELRRNIAPLVAATGAAWLAVRGHGLLTSLSGRLVEDGPGRYRIEPAHWPDLFAAGLGPVEMPTVSALCAIAPEIVVEGFVRLAEAALAGASPLPLRERIPLIENRVAEIAALEAEHRDLVNAARERGLTLAHLPGEVARQYAARQEAERVERDARVNRGHYQREAERREP